MRLNVERDAVILASLKFIEAHLDMELTVEDISAAAGYSSFYFSRLFKAHSGLSVMDYVRKRRLSRAYNEVVEGAMIIDAALNNGYASHSGFSRAFRQEFGFSPALLKVIHEQLKHLKGGSAMKQTFLKPSQLHAHKEMLYENIISAMKENGTVFDDKMMHKAYSFACDIYKDMHRYSGEEYITHTLNTALLVAQAGAEMEPVMAAMFCDCLAKTKVDVGTLKTVLPEAVVDIVTDAAKSLDLLSVDEQEWAVLVKLAERLHNMRTLDFMDSSSYQIKARETVQAYLPLAKEIGCEAMGRELYALSAKYLV